MLNDIAWLQFVGGLSLVTPMFITVAIVALNDKSSKPVFPRWSGFVSAWAFVLLLPDQMLFFFKTGPFAWNGLIAFWIPVPTFFVWFVMIFYLIRKDVLEEGRLQGGVASASL